MSKMFFLMSVILLFCAVSIKAEATTETSPNPTTNSGIGVPPQIMWHDDNEGINSNYDSKSNFEKQADRALSLKVQQTLTGNPQLTGKLANIRITAVEGSVILEGTVNNEKERANIVHQVEKMAGVDHVDDQLTIGSK